MACKPILIVEDDADIREALQAFFEAEGYPVLLAKHGQAALDLFGMNSTITPGLIFLDLTMPVMDGAAFLAELQRNYPIVFQKTPIFIMSARADTHSLTHMTTGFLKKPFDLDQLCRIAACFMTDQTHLS